MTRPIWLLSIAAFMAAAMTRITDALLPAISQDLNVGVDDAALAITAFTFAYGLFQLVYGWIGGRLGPYRTAAVASSLAATGAIISALSTDLTTLAIGRFWSGMTVAAVIPMSMAFIGETVPYEQRQPVIARFLMGQVLGVVLGQAFAGFFAQIFDWRDLFWILALGLGLISLGLWRELRGPLVPAFQAPAQSVSPIRAYLRVLEVPWARVILLSVMIEGFLCFGAFPFLAPHLAENIGLTQLGVGLTMSCFGLGGLIYIMAVRQLHGRLGETGLVLWGGTAIAVGFWSLVWLTNAITMGMAAGLIGLGFYMVHNTLQTNATQMAPFDRSAAIALFAFCLFVSQAAGVAIAAPVSQLIGYTPIFAITSLLVLLLAIGIRRALQRKTSN